MDTASVILAEESTTTTTQGTFFKGFFRENIGDFTELHNEKKSIWKLRVNRIL